MTSQLAAPSTADILLARYRQVRQQSETLCEPLETEDFVIQSMPDVSPTRWHLAHTTWFFETFVLRAADPGYRSPDAAFEYLFNSYYNTVGDQYPRAKRGLLTRPTVVEVFEYRRHVNEAVAAWLADADDERDAELLRVVELGLHHEQQHQELMLTDIKHVLSCNPLYPAYRARSAGCQPANEVGTDSESNGTARRSGRLAACTTYPEQLAEIGYDGDGFCYDNERPRHRTFVHGYELANQLVTNAEYLEFVEAGGYDEPRWWLSLGWATVQEQGWQAPLYWVRRDGAWQQFTLAGLVPLALDEPVCHVSYFEADAFARWSGKRLPTEAEWEVAAADVSMEGPIEGNFVESGEYHPRPSSLTPYSSPRQLFGDLWEWTASPYTAYPGYQPPPGALGEYNGKFMCNQYVLRGGSCATSQSHIRTTYRNFFPPEARWQFTGIRLAQ